MSGAHSHHGNSRQVRKRPCPEAVPAWCVPAFVSACRSKAARHQRPGYSPPAACRRPRRRLRSGPASFDPAEPEPIDDRTHRMTRCPVSRSFRIRTSDGVCARPSVSRRPFHDPSHPGGAAPSPSPETPMPRLRRTGAGRAADRHRDDAFGTDAKPRNHAGKASARACRATLRTETGNHVMHRITPFCISESPAESTPKHPLIVRRITL